VTPHICDNYNPNFKFNVNIKIGLYQCLERMVPNASGRCKINLQLDSFNDAKGCLVLRLLRYKGIKRLQLNGWILMGMNVQSYKNLQFEF